jgi:ribosomal protein L37AE/L43A
VTTRKYEKCSDEEHRSIAVHTCPDCGQPLQEGPHGGLSVNWLCMNPRCGSKFNEMGPFGSERISDAQPMSTLK